MNLEKLFELVFNNPDDVSIHYTNKNGKEKLIVNGEEISYDTAYDDSLIKQKISLYKEKIENLSDYIFEKVLNEAERRKFNLYEMNKGIALENYNSEQALYADNVIELMTELIQDVLKDEIQTLVKNLEQF